MRKENDMATLIKIDRNGTKYYQGEQDCPRCDGKGIYYMGVCNGKLVPSWVDNGVCFQCLGSGKVIEKWKEYTPEYEQKLAERREKKRIKYEQEHADEIAKRKAEQEEKARIKREQEEQAERERLEKERIEQERKANSKFVGSVGDKIEQSFTLNYSASFECQSFGGYGTTTMFIHSMSDEHGNTFIWKTNKSLSKKIDDNAWQYAESGDVITLKGTIKEHNEYKDEKQTVMTRCKVINIEFKGE